MCSIDVCYKTYQGEYDARETERKQNDPAGLEIETGKMNKRKFIPRRRNCGGVAETRPRPNRFPAREGEELALVGLINSGKPATARLISIAMLNIPDAVCPEISRGPEETQKDHHVAAVQQS